MSFARRHGRIIPVDATLLMRHRDISSLATQTALIPFHYRFIHVRCKSKGIEYTVRLERGETNQSTLRHNQFEYTRYMSWKALNTIRMIGSATPREIAIHMRAICCNWETDRFIQRRIIVAEGCRCNFRFYTSWRNKRNQSCAG